MMAQLGIKRLRPAPSGNESAPNQANYDEAKANPFPNLPEVLTLENGKKVTTAETWWKERRPQIVETFERDVIGRVPRGVPRVAWSVVNSTKGLIGKYPVVGRQLAWRQHDGGHTDAPNWKYFIPWADRQLKR